MDIKTPWLLYLKALLFVLLGLMASTVLLLEHPSLRNALLLAMAVWSFARAYYFVFYVIQHYVDDSYRFSGLWSFVQYLVRRKP
jgi:hypothetical protein